MKGRRPHDELLFLVVTILHERECHNKVVAVEMPSIEYLMYDHIARNLPDATIVDIVPCAHIFDLKTNCGVFALEYIVCVKPGKAEVFTKYPLDLITIGFRLYSSVKRWNEPRATPIIGVATKLTLMGRSKWLVVLMLRGCWAFGKRRLARERTVC